jgi:clan AA aspartic protease
MGSVYAEIKLINAVDLEMSRRNLIGEEEIKHINARMLVDSGAFMMCINENIQEVLNLSFIEKRIVRLTDDQPTEFDVVGPIKVKFANRTAICSALVLAGNSEPLLGKIPMKEMDVLIHPLREELIVNPKHPDGAVPRL